MQISPGSVEEVAQLFNTSTDEFTPERFKQVYENICIWIKEHEKEAVEDNPNTEAELEIIEELKNETSSAPQPQPDSTVEDGGTDSTVPIEDDSGSERKLVLVAKDRNRIGSSPCLCYLERGYLGAITC